MQRKMLRVTKNSLNSKSKHKTIMCYGQRSFCIQRPYNVELTFRHHSRFVNCRCFLQATENWTVPASLRTHIIMPRDRRVRLRVDSSSSSSSRSNYYYNNNNNYYYYYYHWSRTFYTANALPSPNQQHQSNEGLKQNINIYAQKRNSA